MLSLREEYKALKRFNTVVKTVTAKRALKKIEEKKQKKTT